MFFTSPSARETRGCGNGPSCDGPWRSLLAETGWELLDAFRLTDDLWGSSHRPFTPNGSTALELGTPVPSFLSRIERMPGLVRPYTDNFHFRCEIYAELNRQLLDILCPLSTHVHVSTGRGSRQQQHVRNAAVGLAPGAIR